MLAERVGADALDSMVRAADGFAYMIQLVGFRTWKASSDLETMSLDHAQRGIVSFAMPMLREYLLDEL